MSTAARQRGPIVLWRALSYLGPYKRDAIGASASLILVSAANLAMPQLLRYAIDVGIAKRQINAMLISIGGLCTVAIGRAMFTFFQGYLAERASQGAAYDLRVSLFARIQRLSFSYYDRVHTGQLLTRLTNDVDHIRGFVGSGIVQLTGATILLFGTIFFLLAMNWRLAIVTLATIPASLILLILIGRRIAQLFSRIQQSLGRLTTVLQEDLTGMRMVRAFAREEYECNRFGAANKELLDRNIDFLRSFSQIFPFVLFLANLGTLAVIWYGGLEAIAGRLTIGELIAFYSYLSFLHLTIMMITFGGAAIPRAQAASKRVFEILDAELEVRDAPNAKSLSLIIGRVEFRDVRFRYPGSNREILRGLNFSVEPGQKVALVGPIGSGKSTTINLLPRFYDVRAGSVLIDGLDVRELAMASLRGHMGIVLQETLLFSGSVRDNIAYGKPDATQEEIEYAARAAQADGFINLLLQGYDTVIGEREVGLSGGERQRIAIARAILINLRLLILDDSTSSVDARTEAAILEALSRLMREGGRTVFVIAHRLSTVRDADLILVFNEGQIVAQGTLESLLGESPLYNEILGSQIVADLAPEPG